MAFKKRSLRIQFHYKGDAAEQVLDITDLRTEAIISNPGGDNMFGVCQLRVFGMLLSDMQRFTTDGVAALQVHGDTVKVLAGTEGEPIQQVFAGTIYSAYVDFSGQPDVCLNITARSAFYEQVTPATRTSVKGSDKVSKVIEGLAKKMGHGFHDGGVDSIITDSYVTGPVVKQIKAIAAAANIPVSFENNIVAIWPNQAARDSEIIDVSPGKGLVGYPIYQTWGLEVRTIFNPNFLIGRKVKLSGSALPKADGIWYVVSATHELSAVASNGPWYSSVRLTTSGLYVRF